MTLMSSREFNQDTGKAKKMAEKEPVFVTDRGETTHVLLSMNEYAKLANKGRKLPPEFENYKAAKDLAAWLLGQSR